MTNNPYVFLAILGIALLLTALNLGVYLFRRPIFRWLCRRRIRQGRASTLDDMLSFARCQKFISQKDERILRMEFELD